MMKVYLAGPINGCTDEEAMRWRRRAHDLLALAGHSVLDPMARDYRGREAENVEAIVEGDLADIGRADALLVNAERPSWGTAMEVRVAHDARIPVFAFCPGRASPWLAYHARVAPDIHRALEALLFYADAR